MIQGFSKPKLVVLVHEKDLNFDAGIAILRGVLKNMAARGYPVETVRGYRGDRVGDVVLNHVDVSVLPPEYQDYLALYPRAINGGVADIRKRSYSTLLVGPDSDYDGPVIVKTDDNCGGAPDFTAQTSQEQNSHLRRRQILKYLPFSLRLRWVRELDSAHYPVYESLAAVPWGVFRNPALIVEKFVPEREGELYSTRTHLFMGDLSQDFLMKSKTPVTKGWSLIERQPVETHPALRQWKQEQGFEYGKLEYVVHNGQAIVLDANTTPTYGVFNNPKTDLNMEKLVPLLADGLEAHLQTDGGRVA